MPRPHIAAIVEDAWIRRASSALSNRGWQHRIVPFTGYGTPRHVRVLARVLMARRSDDGEDRPGAGIRERAEDSAMTMREAILDRRGWRAFVTPPPGVGVPVTVVVGDRRVKSESDRAGLVDVVVRRHGLDPGWRRVRIEAETADPVEAHVLIIGPEPTMGVISDIDDTVLATSLPRPMVAAWNTFFRTEGSRRAVSGMATFYREIRSADPGIPVIYVSTGSWSTQPWLARFLRRNGYPAGPMLLTDWGPTSTGWFRSGQQHKRGSLHRLAREFPQVRWLLVGDDGQHDPKLYAEFAAARPSAVVAIAIRELSAGEQVLSHGLPVANDQFAPAPVEDLQVPVVRAPDGYELARQLRPVLAKARQARQARQVGPEEARDA